jgi:hypothetical protein
MPCITERQHTLNELLEAFTYSLIIEGLNEPLEDVLEYRIWQSSLCELMPEMPKEGIYSK